jgi:hypothetical protein
MRSAIFFLLVLAGVAFVIVRVAMIGSQISLSRLLAKRHPRLWHNLSDYEGWSFFGLVATRFAYSDLAPAFRDHEVRRAAERLRNMEWTSWVVLFLGITLLLAYHATAG